jgi:hypothetical protein
VFHTFDAHQRVGYLPDFRAFPLHYQHFQAMVVIQVHMHAGQNLSVIVVLNVGELVRQRT